MTVKLIHLTDPHLVAPGEPLYGLDPMARLELALAEIDRAHRDAALILMTGDLTNDGDLGAYRALRRALDRLGLPYRLMMGNHDRRDSFFTAFPDAPRTEEGFVQGTVDLPGMRLVYLDSLDPPGDGGRLGSERLGWLERTLEASQGMDLLVAVHHPPMPVGIPSMDRIALADGEAMGDLLVAHGRVRHLLLGHVHRPIAGNWRGIPFTVQRGTSHQCSLGLVEAEFHAIHEPPAMGILLIAPDRLIVHAHDFLGGAARLHFGDPRAKRARTPGELPPFEA